MTSDRDRSTGGTANEPGGTAPAPGGTANAPSGSLNALGGSRPRLIRRTELRDDPTPTPGMRRVHAIEANGLTSGLVQTAPGKQSGWHHHGDHETSIHVLAGILRMEDATGAFDAQPGDFIHVPAGAVHRESNPSDVESVAVFSRAGRGAVTVNVDGPA